MKVKKNYTEVMIMIVEAYQGIQVGKAKYWDYNFKLNGIVYEVSVNIATGKMYIEPDEDPELKQNGGEE
jgi:hypothetical protein